NVILPGPLAAIVARISGPTATGRMNPTGILDSGTIVVASNAPHNAPLLPS
ncbi:uncharacterized protein METZ01_LOCUS152718, partial [marine metagenome]